MSDPKIQNGEAKRLTLEDPVPLETIQTFREIQTAKTTIAVEFLALEERKIQLLASNKKLQQHHDRLFHSILIERGLNPETPAELDGNTGKLVLRVVQGDDAPPQEMRTDQPS